MNNISQKRLIFNHASAAIIVDENNKFLLQLRDNKKNIFYPNHWGLFGGAKDRKEKPILTIKREIREELNLKINKYKYLFEFSFDLRSINKKNTIRTYFLGRISKNQKKKIILKEGSKFKFFNINNIFKISNIVPYDLHAIWLYKNFY